MKTINDILCENLQREMVRLDMDYRALANASGLTRSGIYKIVEGLRWPSADNLARIAKAINRSVSWLFKDRQAPSNEITPTDALAVLTDFVSRATLAPIKGAPGDSDDLAERLTLASQDTRDLICAALEGDAIGKEKSVRRLVQKLRNHSND